MRASPGQPATCRLVSPFSGWLDDLGAAPDPVFAERMMGDGLLLDPLEGMLRAPCAAEVIAVPTSGHAITLRHPSGAEILLHVGIDTVALGGRGFRPLVSPGEQVEEGTPLLEIDLAVIADEGKSLATPVVITNGARFAISWRAAAGAVVAGEPVLELTALAAAPETAPSGPADRFASAEIDLPLAHGLHARPAARLVAVSKQFSAAMTLHHGGRSADARSVAALMALGVGLGATVTVEAQGTDAREAVVALLDAIAAGLGETPVDLAARSVPTTALPETAPAVQPVALDGTAILTGVTGAPGTVIGPIVHLREARRTFPEQGRGPSEERQRFEAALTQVKLAVSDAGRRGGSAQQAILAAHEALLDDPTLIDRAASMMASGKSAEWAWAASCDAVADQLASLPDARLRERADDLRDLRGQLLDALAGRSGAGTGDVSGAIVVAEDLVPSQFIRLADAGVAGICTLGGGATAHVSILAAARGIPALVATEPRVTAVPAGTVVALTADLGRMEIAPTPSRQIAIEQQRAAHRRNLDEAVRDAAGPAGTTDGVTIEVFANLGASADASAAVARGAEGCGLLRSEFLFMDRAAPPGEDEQFAQYQAAADGLGARTLVIRTLDIGGDKPVPFLPFPLEENPALGLRGLRLSLRHPELLKTQFRALLRVRSAASVQVMLPMVIEPGEVIAARALLDEARQELGLTTSLPLGIMVETPAAALLADALAAEADFFSIGTNDLTQYVLAIDRASVPLAAQSDGLHPAVLRSIRDVCAAGLRAGRSVSVCGALGGDVVAIPLLIGLGLRRLSMTPSRLAVAKAVVRQLAVAECERAAAHALTLGSPEAVRTLVRRTWPQLDAWA